MNIFPISLTSSSTTTRVTAEFRPPKPAAPTPPLPARRRKARAWGRAAQRRPFGRLRRRPRRRRGDSRDRLRQRSFGGSGPVRRPGRTRRGSGSESGPCRFDRMGWVRICQTALGSVYLRVGFWSRELRKEWGWEVDRWLGGPSHGGLIFVTGSQGRPSRSKFNSKVFFPSV